MSVAGGGLNARHQIDQYERFRHLFDREPTAVELRRYKRGRSGLLLRLPPSRRPRRRLGPLTPVDVGRWRSALNWVFALVAPFPAVEPHHAGPRATPGKPLSIQDRTGHGWDVDMTPIERRDQARSEDATTVALL